MAERLKTKEKQSLVLAINEVYDMIKDIAGARILNAPKRLWSGVWNFSGTIAVPGVNAYSLYIVYVTVTGSAASLPLIGVKNPAGGIEIIATGVHDQGWAGGQISMAINLIVSGNTLRNGHTTRGEQHTPGSGHGAFLAMAQMSAIYGVL